jgi:hypothetical protein
MNGSDDRRRKVTSIIVSRVDQGERDPTQLADAANRELAGRNCSIAG